MLANITPACNCGDYIQEGQELNWVAGDSNDQPAWWVACPTCNRTLGCAIRYPVIASKSALLARGFIDEPNNNN